MATTKGLFGANRLAKQPRTPEADAADHKEVARIAYELYIERGCVDGCDVDDWVQAERIVRAKERQNGRARV